MLYLRILDFFYRVLKNPFAASNFFQLDILNNNRVNANDPLKKIICIFHL